MTDRGVSPSALTATHTAHNVSAAPSPCLVTGGAGFIGSHVVDLLLANGHSVTVVDNLSTGRLENLAHHAANPRLRVERFDINDTDRLAALMSEQTRVFHLAALADIVPSIERPADYFHANVDGTFSVMEAARRAGAANVVYAASSSCYGIADTTPTPETAPARPMYPYALTKYLGEQLVIHWGQVYKLPVTCLRLFNVYGPRSRTTGTYGAVFGVFLAQKLAGKPFTVVGDGTQSRDFVFVTDVAAAFVRAAFSSVSGEVFNVAANAPVSVNRLTELLGGPVTHVPKRPGEPDVTHADVAKIHAQLGWQATVSIEQGVAELVANIEHWRSAPVWTVDAIADATKAWFQFLGTETATGRVEDHT